MSVSVMRRALVSLSPPAVADSSVLDRSCFPQRDTHARSFLVSPSHGEPGGGGVVSHACAVGA